MSPSEMPTLLSLPTRVKQQIWLYSLNNDVSLRRPLCWEEPTSNGPGSLLCVSRATHDECFPVFYSVNTFFVRCPNNLRLDAGGDKETPQYVTEEGISLQIGFVWRCIAFLKSIAVRLPILKRSKGLVNVHWQCARLLSWLLRRAQGIDTIEIQFYKEGDALPAKCSPYDGASLARLLRNHQNIFRVLDSYSISRVRIVFYALHNAEFYVKTASGSYSRRTLRDHTPNPMDFSQEKVFCNADLYETVKRLAFADVDLVAARAVECAAMNSPPLMHQLAILRWDVSRQCERQVLDPAIPAPVAEEVAVASQRSSSSLLMLPREIRDIIWGLISTFDGTLMLRDRTSRTQKSALTFLPTCRQVAAESLVQLYRNNDFRLDVSFDIQFSTISSESAKSIALGILPSHLSHLRSIVLDLDVTDLLVEEVADMMMWLRHKARSIDKMSMTISMDQLVHWLRKDSGARPEVGLETLAHLVHTQNRLFQSLDSFEDLRLIDITIKGHQDLPGFNRVQLKKPLLFELSESGLHSVQSRCFQRASRGAFDIVFRRGLTYGFRMNVWRWIIELNNDPKLKGPTALPRPGRALEDWCTLRKKGKEKHWMYRCSNNALK